MMILPIVAYGHPVLRKVANDIDENYPDLKKLIEDMWETMYASNGVGLAAPQVNRDIRLFVIDSAQIFNNMDEEERNQHEYPDDPGVKETFINARIVEELGDDWAYNEGAGNNGKNQSILWSDDAFWHLADRCPWIECIYIPIQVAVKSHGCTAGKYHAEDDKNELNYN